MPATREARAAPASQPPLGPTPSQPRSPAAQPSEFRNDAASVDLPAEVPLVGPHGVASRSLGALIAIMTFLCALLWGGVVLVERAADAWGASVRGEISVTVLPLDASSPIDERVAGVASILGDTPALSSIRIVPAPEAAAMLEPWLGDGLDLSRLPVPRLVTARSDGTLDAIALSEALAGVEGTALDTHEGWSDRLSAMAARVAGGTVAALALMMLATALSVVFATRAAIAANGATVEVLHLLGADEGFVSHAFRSRFWRIGLVGAFIGASAAAILFGALAVWGVLTASGETPQTRALFGDPSIGLGGFLGIFAVALVIALLTALASDRAVRRFLKDREI